MNRRQLIAVALILGVALGELSARVLFVGSWASLIIWGVAGVLVGYRTTDMRTARAVGSVYGFVLVAAFILFGYGGAMTVHGWTGAGILALIFGAIGALCGMLSAVVGNILKSKLINK